MSNVVLVVPTDLRDKINSICEDLGYGPNTFSIPLAADEKSEPTHWSVNYENPPEAFLKLVDELQGSVEQDLIKDQKIDAADLSSFSKELISATEVDHKESVENLSLKIVEGAVDAVNEKYTSEAESPSKIQL